MSYVKTDDAERLGRALALKAEERDEFIGSAFALWRKHHDRNVEDQLKCSSDVVWRLAVTPKPAADERFTERVMSLAAGHGANPTELVRLLRWAHSVRAMWGASEGEGLLKAALDGNTDEAQ